MTQTASPLNTVQCFGNVDVPIPKRIREFDNARAQIGDFMFSVLTPRDGDKRLVWNRFNVAEVDDARKLFGDLLAQGMTAHRVGRDGKPDAEVLKDFDAVLEEIAFLDDDEEEKAFGAARHRSARRDQLVRASESDEVIFLPRRQIVGG